MILMNSESAPNTTTTNNEHTIKKKLVTKIPHDEADFAADSHQRGAVTGSNDVDMGGEDTTRQQESMEESNDNTGEDATMVDLGGKTEGNTDLQENPNKEVTPENKSHADHLTADESDEQPKVATRKPDKLNIELNNETAAKDTATPLADSDNKAAANDTPPPPLLKGTLTYNLESRRHILRGNWNYDYSTTPPEMMPAHKFPAQRFELIRNFPATTPEEEIKQIPSDGEFHGSFSLAYFHITKNGKSRERSKVVPESGVHIQFEPLLLKGGKRETDDISPGAEFKVTGRGTNQFGQFDIYGSATRSGFEGDQDTFHVELRKRYIAPSVPAPAPASSGDKKKRPSESTVVSPTAKKSKLDQSAEGNAASASEISAAVHSELNDEAAAVDLGNVQELPPPSESFPVGVVCLRGKLFRDAGDQVGILENHHRIRGMWSTGLDILLSDPNNDRGLCNPFDYEHKSIDEKNGAFPLSGRYTGYFYITNEDGSRTRVVERDVSLKFKPNNDGGYNVEGKGSNMFGRYTISGTLEENAHPTEEDVGKGKIWLITIFRHFQPRKIKKDKKNLTEAVPVSAGVPPPTNKVAEPELPSLSLAHVVVPGLADFKPTALSPELLPEPIVPPDHGNYSAVSRGVLRINTDGAHTCGGKWAISREHFGNNISSNFHFGLEAHHALEEAKQVLASQGRLPASADTALPSDLPVVFPLDSSQYKGSFRMKRGANKFSSVIDKQIVLKFVRNSAGSFNVYGKGVNNIGQFDLIGTLIQQGQSSGQVELYRVYSTPDAASTGTTAARATKVDGSKEVQGANGARAVLSTATSAVSPPAPVMAVSAPRMLDLSAEGTSAPAQVSSLNNTTPVPGLLRTESGRSVKLPSRLEDSDPEARKARILEKCSHILAFLREQDAASGSFFAEPVDPVALGIPTYNQIITNPMDLGTIQQKLRAGQVDDHEEFARLVRLVFENAIRFNVDPSHSVHVRARELLLLFNRKYADVERIASSINEKRRLSKTEIKAKQREEKRKEKEAAKEAKRKAKEEKAERKKRQKEEFAVGQPSSLGSLPSMEFPSAPQTAAPEGFVAKAEFDQLHQQMQHMQLMLSALQQQLVAVGAPMLPLPNMPLPAMRPAVPAPPVALAPSPDKRPVGKGKGKGFPKRSVDEDLEEGEEEDLDSTPLTLKEQEQLTRAINRLGGDKLNGVIQIIRESTKLSGDEDEIDLEIDQLDIPTQRKLQRFVLKTAKPKRAAKKPPAKKPAPKKTPIVVQAAAAPTPTVVDVSAKAPAGEKKANKKPKPSASSFLGFAGPDASSDESDDDSVSSSSDSDEVSADKKEPEKAENADTFALPDHSMDMDDDLNDDAIASKNWNLSAAAAAAAAAASDDEDESDDDDKDTLWGAARVEAETNRQREAERKAREDKLRAQAELESKERLASAQATADMIRAKRLEEEEEEAKLQEEKAREAEERRREAREAVRKNVMETKQTVDLDAQRDLMEMYERSIIDNELGDSASPRSDFGF